MAAVLKPPPLATVATSGATPVQPSRRALAVAPAGPAVEATDHGGEVPGLISFIPVSTERRAHSGDVSEGPSESSANREDETEEDAFQSTIPNLEKFYEQMAAKARLPGHPGHGASSSWVLSLARTYRRLSKDKRRRGRLRSLLQTAAQGAQAASSSGLPCPMREQPGWNTDDSGYEAGYETDADESELSEWESGTSRRGCKRKLDALVHLTMRLGFSERSADDPEDSSMPQMPPPKTPRTPRALGTQPAGLRLPLPHASAAVPHSAMATNHAEAAPTSSLTPAPVQSSPPATAEYSMPGGSSTMDVG